ncbi:helix-turn-helix domain-containing protein [Leuconostoc suionicum]|uniref:helix-turn-helix domain-containing protein n=1 Tax=Leuconostoc suionicum TaxID=1511761 RepID=UPI003C6BA776
MSVTANRIKELRTQKKLTQSELAETINTSRVTISRIESETRQPSYAMLSLIADALDTTVEYLAGTTNNPAYKPAYYGENKKLSSDAFVPNEHQFTEQPVNLDNLFNSVGGYFVSDVKLNGDEYEQVQDFVNYLLWKRKK